tara:strand:- start:17 stop:460 length:444 start_codon:yes stop_codon:yes gene_type:complete
MDIILLEDVEKLGFKDEIISVKKGFGRNFLIPQRKAILADKKAIKILNEKLRQQEKKEQKVIEAANQIAEKISELEIIIKAKVGEDGKKLFGSVNASHLAASLSELGYNIDKRFTKVNSIKEIGKYEADIRLHKNVSITVGFEVIAS